MEKSVNIESTTKNQLSVESNNVMQKREKKVATEGKVWVGTSSNPESKEISIDKMKKTTLAKEFDFKVIKFLVSSDHDYITSDESGNFSKNIRYGLSYLVVGLEKNEDKCIRCRKTFQLGDNTRKCHYHPGERIMMSVKDKKSKKKKDEKENINEEFVERWSCCSGEEIFTLGCEKAKGHVGYLTEGIELKPIGEVSLDPIYDPKSNSRKRKKKEKQLQKLKPFKKPGDVVKSATTGVAVQLPRVKGGTNDKTSDFKPDDPVIIGGRDSDNTSHSSSLSLTDEEVGEVTKKVTKKKKQKHSKSSTSSSSSSSEKKQ